MIPARIYAQKESGAQIELVLLRQLDQHHWQSLVRPGKKALPGVRLKLPLEGVAAQVEEMAEDGTRIIRFDFTGDFFALLDQMGQMPLPPYIKEKLEIKTATNQYTPEKEDLLPRLPPACTSRKIYWSSCSGKA